MIFAAIGFIDMATTSEPIDSGLSDGWEFSINVPNVLPQSNINSIINMTAGTNILELTFVDKKNTTERATIFPFSSGIKSFDNQSMQNYLENQMKSRDLSNISFHSKKIANAKGMAGKGYNNGSRSWEFLAYFPVWPSNSTSDRAALIVSTFKENASNQLFDTIQVKQCPGKLPPIENFTYVQYSKNPRKLSTQNKSLPVHLG
jgi:hypothetical protein